MKKLTKYKATINHQIPFPEFIVIDQHGNNKGKMLKKAAIELAEAAEMDLVLISSSKTKPVCRILNLSKYLYEKQKLLKKSLKKKNINTVKEIRFFATIGENDFKLRIKKTIDFLNKGYTVKISMFLRGREKYIKNYGIVKFESFVAGVKKYGVNDKPFQKKPNSYSIQFKPLKTKNSKK